MLARYRVGGTLGSRSEGWTTSTRDDILGVTSALLSKRVTAVVALL
jgi:hypothetical protein